MATLYVRSTDGSDADNGTTWALAKAKLSGAAAIDAAGDTVYVSASHSETNSGASVTLAWAGTNASPVKVVCVDDTGDPATPTAEATTGVFDISSINSLTITGAVYMSGLTFKVGSGGGSGNAFITVGDDAKSQHYKDCSFQMLNNDNSGGNRLGIGGTSGGGQDYGIVTKFENCTAKWTHPSGGIYGTGIFHWKGGSILSGSATPISFFKRCSNGFNALIENVDFSNFTTPDFGCDHQAGDCYKIVFRNCKIPAGTTISTPDTYGSSIEMFNCDSADTNYRLFCKYYEGSVVQETTIVRTGGATDGTTPISWKMDTTANAEFPHLVLRSPEIVAWNDTTGSAITVTVEVVHDSKGSGTSSAMTDKEMWLEVQYLGTSGVPLGSSVSDGAGLLATAADQTSSSATWTTTGLTTPVKQKLSVTFTPQKKGAIHARVCMAGVSDTAYIDPLLTVT